MSQMKNEMVLSWTQKFQNVVTLVFEEREKHGIVPKTLDLSFIYVISKSFDKKDVTVVKKNFRIFLKIAP